MVTDFSTSIRRFKNVCLDINSCLNRMYIILLAWKKSYLVNLSVLNRVVYFSYSKTHVIEVFVLCPT